MYLLPIEDAVPGMVLARTIFNERGDVLLRAGVSLTANYLLILRNRGFQVLYLRDREDEEVPDDIVTERVRQQAYQRLRAVYDLPKLVTKSLAKVPSGRRSAALSDGHLPIATAERQFFDDLVEAVNALIEDVIGAPLLFNLHTLRTHDSYTFNHCVDMTIVALLLGKKLYLSFDRLRDLALGCMLHDIGKLFVPPEILNKPGKLTDEEWEVMRQHPRMGYDFLQHSALNGINLMSKHVALQHHERQDGTGYPRGLVGTNELRLHSRTPAGRILPIAEIAAVADVYDAIRADRPYRPAFPPEQVVAILREMAGNHLNRRVVETLLSVAPVYPAGSRIVVLSGDLKGYQGVVADTPPDALDRPRIRLLEDQEGRTILPIELDLSENPALEIATAEGAVRMAQDLLV